ncbi:transmembrane protein [Pimephales promelas]|nr:transmembrane protein [Pimephales promelas]
MAILIVFPLENQPHERVCKPAYLLPFPIPDDIYNTTSYQTAIIYRGFWSVSMLVGVATVVAGGFIIICAAPFASHRLYKAGGGLYLISGFFLLTVTVMYVIWIDVLEVMSSYEEYQRNQCLEFELNVTYGLSFMFAPVGVFFCRGTQCGPLEAVGVPWCGSGEISDHALGSRGPGEAWKGVTGSQKEKMCGLSSSSCKSSGFTVMSRVM